VGADVGACSLPRLIVAALAVLPASVFAFHDASAATSDPAIGNFEVLLVGLLAASALAYAGGVAALWRKAGIGRGIRAVEVARFVLGWSVLAAALLSPIDALAGRSFAMHMVQHELLMVVAAPLLVLARPLQAWAWALPSGGQRAFAAAVRPAVVRGAWRALTEPVGAWCFHALALWIWHLPFLFLAALTHEGLHVLQHACFFTSALAFWWAVFGGALRAPGPISVACLFTTMLHTGVLGALLTFAPTPWYAHQATLLGLTALEDQELGGLVMWIPGSLAYLVAGLAIVAAWLSPARVRHDVG
jgi:putative membrane protein